MEEINRQEEIEKRYQDVAEKIQEAALKVGRNPKDINLVVVTKQKSAVIDKYLAELGLLDMGESYLKEAEFKIEILKEYPIRWHMIGNIQRGKEREVAHYFDMVHSVDNYEVAERLNQSCKENGKIMPIFLECNVSGEGTKAGWDVVNDKEWPIFVEDVKQVLDLDHLKLLGLMTMAPYSTEPEDARPFFRKIKSLLNYINQKFPQQEINELSMGMSGDFQVAIEEGATYLRIGSAIVGKR